MSRTLSEIFNEAKAARQQRLELSEIDNPSKTSIMDAITWVAAACIWSFENLLDLFQVQISQDISARINGTPEYYAQALRKYQQGDELRVSADGTKIEYANIDESKRIITRVSYQENSGVQMYDRELFLKIAQGAPGNFSQITDLGDIRNYLYQIAFAGTAFQVVSRKGDVMVPRMVIYYDGRISADDLKNNIKAALNQFIADLPFDAVVYEQKVVDAIQRVEHVNDVQDDGTYTVNDTPVELGLFVAQYDDDNVLGQLNKVNRYFLPNSGYVKESTGVDPELPEWEWTENLYLIINNPQSGQVIG